MALILSTSLMYGMYFCSVAVSLYVGRLSNIYQIFPHIFDAGRYPIEIYPIILQRLFTTILPLGVILLVPAGLLVSKANYCDILRLAV